MNKILAIALLGLFASTSALADDTAVTKSKPITTAEKTQKSAKKDSGSFPQLAGLSQRDKMRECNKLATGKKGDERKQFMKGCLSKKA